MVYETKVKDHQLIDQDLKIENKINLEEVENGEGIGIGSNISTKVFLINTAIQAGSILTKERLHGVSK